MSNPKLLDYFETKIKALLNKKVDKIPGKGLSTEDYTTAEKTKLAGIPSGGGGGVIVDSAMSSTSENPVQNKVIYNALQNKVTKVTGKGLSTEDYTTAEKEKLAGLDPNPIMIDDELDAASTDPVQNKVIYAALSDKVDNVTGKGLSTEDYTTAEKTKLSNIDLQSITSIAFQMYNNRILIWFYTNSQKTEGFRLDFDATNKWMQYAKLPVTAANIVGTVSLT